MKIFYFLILAFMMALSGISYADNRNLSKSVFQTPINTSGWSDSPYISPDGQKLYFMYARYNFFPTFTGQKPLLSGPMRPGHHPNDQNPYWDSDLYVSQRQKNGTWGPAINLTGVNDDRDNCCAMVVEGTGPARIYYQREKSGKRLDLVYRIQNRKGLWGPELSFPDTINTNDNEDNIHASSDHRRIYFSSDRPGGSGGKDIWFSYLDQNDQWTPAINLGPMINTSADEDQFWMADTADSNGAYTTYFNRTSSTIMMTSWHPDKEFSTPVPLDLGYDHCGEASMTRDQKYLFYVCADVKKQRLIIMSSQRKSDGSWEIGQPVKDSLKSFKDHH